MAAAAWEPVRATTVRCDWGVPLRWAAIRGPAWEDDLRRWLARCRADGLTQIIVTPGAHGVDLSALLPGDVWEDAA